MRDEKRAPCNNKSALHCRLDFADVVKWDEWVLSQPAKQLLVKSNCPALPKQTAEAKNRQLKQGICRFCQAGNHKQVHLQVLCSW